MNIQICMKNFDIWPLFKNIGKKLVDLARPQSLNKTDIAGSLPHAIHDDPLPPGAIWS